MRHIKHLYFSSIVTGAIMGLLSVLSAYGMIQYIAAGSSVISLSAIAIMVGALLGLIVAFVVHKVFRV